MTEALQAGGFSKFAKGCLSELNKPEAYGMEWTPEAVQCLEAAFPCIVPAPSPPPARRSKLPVIFKHKMQCWAPDELADAFRSARTSLCQDQSTALRVAMSLYIKKAASESTSPESGAEQPKREPKPSSL